MRLAAGKRHFRRHPPRGHRDVPLGGAAQSVPVPRMTLKDHHTPAEPPAGVSFRLPIAQSAHRPSSAACGVRLKASHRDAFRATHAPGGRLCAVDMPAGARCNTIFSPRILQNRPRRVIIESPYREWLRERPVDATATCPRKRGQGANSGGETRKDERESMRRSSGAVLFYQ